MAAISDRAGVPVGCTIVFLPCRFKLDTPQKVLLINNFKLPLTPPKTVLRNNNHNFCRLEIIFCPHFENVYLLSENYFFLNKVLSFHSLF